MINTLERGNYMQLNKNQDVRINLKDLFFYLLYRWRSILAAALFGAILLCGLQYWIITSTHNAGKQTKDERQYQLDLQNYQENLESAKTTIQEATKAQQSLNTYRNESVYFNLDPQALWTASNQYLVKVDQSVTDKLPQGSSLDPADSILSAYKTPLSEATDEELMEAFGTERTEYIGELVKTEVSTTENTVTVTVVAATKEKAEAAMTLLNSKMEMLAAEKAQKTDKHTLSLVGGEVKLGANEVLSKKQTELAKTAKENQEILQEARRQLDQLEASGEPNKPGTHLLRMAVIGFMLGAAVLFFIYVATYAFQGKINCSNDLTERYHLPLLGEFHKSGHLHSLKGLDRLIAKRELGASPDPEAIYDHISALIAMKQDKQILLLISTLPGTKLMPVCEALSKRLEDRTIRVQAEMLYNSDAIEEAARADAVILVEEKHISRIKDTDRMAESLKICEANVIGAIVL